nr:unnamed protein product [Callosobruchus analis]
MDNQKLSVISLYRPPNVRASTSGYVNIFKQLKQLKYDCIIGGDFSAHHGMWGSPINSNDGNILAEALESFQDLVLVVANDGSATRLSPPGQAKSVVDVTILSSKLCSSFDWSTLADTFASKLFPVKIVIMGVCPENLTVKSISKWSMKNANWNIYRSEIENSFSGYPCFEHSNDMIVFLSNTTTKLFSKLAPPYAPPPLLHCTEDSEQHFVLKPISTQEMVANIQVSKTTAPGIYGINYLMLANLPQIALDFLCNIYNRILLFGESCNAVKNALVVPVPKPNDPSSLRPISLMPCMLKTLE